MSLVGAARYYRGRVLDYLDLFGFPLRRRALLFYRRRLGDVPPASAVYGDSGLVRAVSMEEFRGLTWPGDPVVTRDAASWKGSGRRWAIVATRQDTLDGFCWLEEGVADLRFFDLLCPLSEHTLYWSRLWVYPALRDIGVGTALLGFTQTFAQRRGAQQLRACCVPRNLRMQRVLEKHGWRYEQRWDYLRAGPAMRYSIRTAGEGLARVYSTSAAQLTLSAGC